MAQVSRCATVGPYSSGRCTLQLPGAPSWVSRRDYSSIGPSEATNAGRLLTRYCGGREQGPLIAWNLSEFWAVFICDVQTALARELARDILAAAVMRGDGHVSQLTEALRRRCYYISRQRTGGLTIGDELEDDLDPCGTETCTCEGK